MLLTIAQKSYINHPVAKKELRDSLANIKRALKAFEQKNKTHAIKALCKAYSFLPHNCLGIRVCADIIESLIQIEAYAQVAELAHNIEAQYHYYYFTDSRTHFDMFRIFANAAEAHSIIGNNTRARRLSKIALDHQLETQDNVCLEMLTLFMK